MSVVHMHPRNYHEVPPRTVRVSINIGPFIGMTGTAVAEDDDHVWVRFEEGGSYAPYDKPGTYGFNRNDLEDV